MSSAYWTVYDGAYEPVAVADCYLRRLRFGSGRALGTTRVYAGNLALFFEFCLASGRSLRRAAFEFDRFVHYLAVTPIERGGRGQGQLRSPERINHILSSVRELYREAVARGMLDGEVLPALFCGRAGLQAAGRGGRGSADDGCMSGRATGCGSPSAVGLRRCRSSSSSA